MEDNEELIWMEARLVDLEIALSTKNHPLFEAIDSAVFVEGVKWVCPVVEDTGPLPFKEAVTQRLLEVYPDVFPSQKEWRIAEAYVRSQSDVYPKLTWWQKLKEKMWDASMVGYAFGSGDVVRVKADGRRASVVKYAPNIAQYRCKMHDCDKSFDLEWFRECDLEKPY